MDKDLFISLLKTFLATRFVVNSRLEIYLEGTSQIYWYDEITIRCSFQALSATMDIKLHIVLLIQLLIPTCK